MIDIKDNNAATGAKLHTQRYSRDNEQQHWEFVIPVVAFPPGWFQIQNVDSKDLLSHKYTFNPPVLEPVNPSQLPSQYRETWNTQWTLVDPRLYNKDIAEENTWCIMNQLTRGFLNVSQSQIASMTGWPGVYASRTESSNFSEHRWVLELDPAYNWTIAYHSTSYLLEGTEGHCNGGKQVVCSDNKLTSRDNKTWFLMYVLVPWKI